MGEWLGRLAKGTWENPARGLIFLGVAYYFVRQVSATFYAVLGVTPEDVGLTYPAILVETVEVVFLVAVVASFPAFVCRMIVGAPFARFLAPSLVPTLPIVVILSLTVAHNVARDALVHGQGSPSLAFLYPWQLQAAQVHWRAGSVGERLGDCVFYIGDEGSRPLVLATDAQGHRRVLTVAASDGSFEIIPGKQRCSWPRYTNG